MKDISLLDLLKSGAHFGHTTSRWNPKMKPFIFTVRNNIHIIDLEKTKNQLVKALNFLKTTASQNQTILLVGTKRQVKDIVRSTAEKAKTPYVNVRWLGGMFTNFKTIVKTIKKLEKLQDTAASPDFTSLYTKKERLLIEREIEKMRTLFEGFKDVRRLPDCMFVFDVHHDDIAVKEAKKLGVKTVGIVDTNTDPGLVDYCIPANDDATKTLALIGDLVAEAILEGRASSLTQPNSQTN